MRVHLTRGPSPSAQLSESDRAALANELGADLLISLHLDGHANPAASGVATYHYGQYGDGGVTSTLGERLAALVQREIVVRTGMRDCRIHAKTWDLLRLTRMPAVRVEAGYLTSREDRNRLVDPLFRDRLVEAIVAAVRRMYLPIESDVTTGSIDVDSIAAARRSPVPVEANGAADGGVSETAAPAGAGRPPLERSALERAAKGGADRGDGRRPGARTDRFGVGPSDRSVVGAADRSVPNDRASGSVL